MARLQRPLTAPEPPCTIHYFTLAKTSASAPVSTLFALPSALKDKKSRGSECLTTGQPRRSKLLRTKELFYMAEVSCPLITRQTFHEHAPISFLEDAIVEQHQQAAIVQRADKPSEA